MQELLNNKNLQQITIRSAKLNNTNKVARWLPKIKEEHLKYSKDCRRWIQVIREISNKSFRLSPEAGRSHPLRRQQKNGMKKFYLYFDFERYWSLINFFSCDYPYLQWKEASVTVILPGNLVTSSVALPKISAICSNRSRVPTLTSDILEITCSIACNHKNMYFKYFTN